jgi:flagellar basal-body rod protein FlgF
MSTTGYINLTRQSGLLQEMQAVANNIANLSTTGFRREGVVFAEFVKRSGGDTPSVSFATATGRLTDPGQGALVSTGGQFDFAIQGDGFFTLETPGGDRLTRAGAFSANGVGELASSDGFRLLDAGGAPIFVPPDATSVTLAADGTLSANGQPIALIGVFLPTDPADLQRESGVMFRTEAGIEPVENPKLFQGFLEASNVSPVTEMARMIEVQRAYELGQNFLNREDERIRSALKILGQ